MNELRKKPLLLKNINNKKHKSNKKMMAKFCRNVKSSHKILTYVSNKNAECIPDMGVCNQIIIDWNRKVKKSLKF